MSQRKGLLSFVNIARGEKFILHTIPSVVYALIVPQKSTIRREGLDQCSTMKSIGFSFAKSVIIGRTWTEGGPALTAYSQSQHG